MHHAGHRRRALTFLAVVAALFVLAQLVDLGAWLDPVRTWLRGTGFWGYVVFAVAYAVLTALGVPGTPLTLAAGVVFGAVPAFVLMVVSTTLSSTLGFFIARRFGRRSVQRWLEGHPLYERFQALVDEQGWIAIPLVRVLPVFPFAFVNYAFGLSKIPFWRYLLASELAMIPMNGIWVGLADAAYGTIIAGEIPWFGLGMATVFGLLLVGLIALVRRAHDAWGDDR